MLALERETRWQRLRRQALQILLLLFLVAATTARRASLNRVLSLEPAPSSPIQEPGGFDEQHRMALHRFNERGAVGRDRGAVWALARSSSKLVARHERAVWRRN